MGLMQHRPQGVSGDRLTAAIVGFGQEGESIYRYLSGQGLYDITIVDDATQTKIPLPSGVDSKLGSGSIEQPLEFDEVWRASPAVAPWRISTSAEIKTITKEFFARCPAPIIGVTGSKGKGTCASLIHEILKTASVNVHLVGNIGRPALDELKAIKPEDVVVFELSSFQLWDLQQSPKTAVVLMVEPEHLDVHKDLEDYLKAKQNIARWQTPEDSVVHHPTNELSLKVAQVGMGRKIPFLTTDAAHIRGEKLYIDEHEICSISEIGLIGKHNHENVAAAVTAAWFYTNNTEAIASAVKKFKGLEHRLQEVAIKNGVRFIDDSIATTPSSAIAAIQSFEEPKILILGGSDKGADYTELGRVVDQQNVKMILLSGVTAPKIASALDAVGFTDYETIEGDMNDVVSRAVTHANEGDVVLLSPASASFDRYRNYQERAERFIESIENV